MNIFIILTVVAISPLNIFGFVELEPVNSLNSLELNSSLSDEDSAVNTSDSRVGRKNLLELHLNPYDPISRIASQLWDHLFSKDRGMLRFPFKKPIPVVVTTIRPIFISLTPPQNSHIGPTSFPPTPSKEENTTMTVEAESPTEKPQEQPQPTSSVKPTPHPSLPTLPIQTIPTQSPPQVPGGGTPQLPIYPPQGVGGPSQGPGGHQPGPGGQHQGPGGPVQGPGGQHQVPGYPPQGPGNTGPYPGQGNPPIQQQPPGYPQRPPGQFIPNQPMPIPGGPYLLDGQTNRPIPIPGFVHHMESIKNSPPESSETNAYSSDDAFSIVIPSAEVEYDETEGFQQNHKSRPSLQRNKTVPFTYANSEVYSTKVKQGLLLHFGSSVNPMKSQLQFYISPDFSLFIKPSKMQSQYGIKKKASGSTLGRPFLSQQKEIEFSNVPSVLDVENLQETIQDEASADKLSENTAPVLNNGFTEGLAYLLEMLAKLSYSTTSFPNAATENVEAATPPTFTTELNNSNLQVEEVSDANPAENISTIPLSSQPQVNETLLHKPDEHENANDTTKHSGDDLENQNQIVSVKGADEENLSSTVGRKSKPLVYYSIIGPKNITYIDINSNGRFGKQQI